MIPMHIHASVLDASIVAAYVILTLWLLRMIEAKWPDSAMAKGLAFIH